MTDNHAADLYDAVNRWGPSNDFFLAVATALHRARLLDLGCGTGGLTIAAARAGCFVTGIDPDRPSLAAARAKPGAGLVYWIDGDSRRIPRHALFDVVLLTSNVVQEILDDADLARTFRDVAAHLVPGGRLAFDSRGYRGEPVGRGTGVLAFTARR
ncbi:MAG TPA: class I SAM-dependent methyltransferase [Arthrobacter sp.]|nr:class I SAM-dependent methyltransferase [Arthrobacter sp.]